MISKEGGPRHPDIEIIVFFDSRSFLFTGYSSRFSFDLVRTVQSILCQHRLTLPTNVFGEILFTLDSRSLQENNAYCSDD